MKKTIKKLWIKSLKSGKYKQGKSCLKQGSKFCCLGVLSDLYAKKYNVKWKKVPFENPKLFEESGVLPSKVMRWAGLSKKNPKVIVSEEIKKRMGWYFGRPELSEMNDRGCDFKTIAQCIDKSL